MYQLPLPEVIVMEEQQLEECVSVDLFFSTGFNCSVYWPLRNGASAPLPPSGLLSEGCNQHLYCDCISWSQAQEGRVREGVIANLGFIFLWEWWLPDHSSTPLPGVSNPLIGLSHNVYQLLSLEFFLCPSHFSGLQNKGNNTSLHCYRQLRPC